MTQSFKQTLFEDRQRAAEYGFTHGEELDFLAHRQGLEAVTRQVAAGLDLDDTATTVTVADTIERYVAGASGTDLVAGLRSRLERAGKWDLAARVDARLERATADATARLRGRAVEGDAPSAGSVPPRPTPTMPHHRHGFWGWDV